MDGVSVDQDSGRIAYSRNVEGYNDLPGGIAGGVSWGPAGERFAVSVTGRSVNTNVFVVEKATGEATRWTHASTGASPNPRSPNPN